TEAAREAGEALWRMPLRGSYKEGLKSHIADLKNTGPRAGGSITAALFLQDFIPEGRPWAHLDIAGTAWKSGQQKGSTGRPVPMLTQFLIDRADRKAST
ncbi:MAG: leucyl aminopeptidase, partial [bacterium]